MIRRCIHAWNLDLSDSHNLDHFLAVIVRASYILHPTHVLYTVSHHKTPPDLITDMLTTQPRYDSSNFWCFPELSTDKVKHRLRGPLQANPPEAS